MDFFTAQDRARTQTKWLTVAFVVALIALIAAFYGVAWGVEMILQVKDSSSAYAPREEIVPLWSLTRLGLVSAGVILVVGCSSLVKMNEFRSGGAAVAQSLGGRRVDLTTRSPLERRLVNVVEEMAIAAGVSVPAIFILDQESGINAFAAGYDPEDAAVAVSQGCLETLSRDELQGVVAHEFSHILNGDMRLNLRLGGIIFGLFVLVVIGRGILYSMRFSRVSSGRSRSGGKGGGGGILIAILLVAASLFVLGLIGQFFGRLIQSAISRQREYLADASAVQFTRNPHGIRDALRRIGGHVDGSAVNHRRAETLAHCFFANALKSSFGGGFSTHPPLPERIHAIDPQWDGSFLTKAAARSQAEMYENAQPAVPSKSAGTGRSRDFAASTVAALAATTAAPKAAQLNYARELRARISHIEASALEDPSEAEAIVLGLFIDPADSSPVPWTLLETTLGYPVREGVERWRRALLDALPQADRLPVFELALAPLMQLDPSAHQRLQSAIAILVALDGTVSLHEFILGFLLQTRFESTDRRGRSHQRTVLDPRDIQPQLERVLSLIALTGVENDIESARELFGSVLVGRPRWTRFTFVQLSRADFAQLEDDLRFLPQISHDLKRELLAIARGLILRDAVVTENEADLYRLLAVLLGIPFAPLLPAESS